MRLLCVFELGSPVESLDHLRQCAESMRRLHPGIEVTLALRGEIGTADTSWADKTLTTPTFKTHTSRDVPGYWNFLHHSGWSDPQLRKVAITIWSNLYRTVKPDFIFAAGSPSALLVASIDNIKAIQVGSGQFIPSVAGWSNPCPFPELESWLFLITRQTAEKLLKHPAIIFAHRAIDEEREGPGFNVQDDLSNQDGLVLDLDVLAIWDERHPLTSKLREYASATWGDRFKEIRSADLRTSGYDEASLRASRPLIIGHYDALSVGIAIKHDLPYIGSPLTKQQVAVAERSENKRITYRLDNNLMMLKSYADEPFVLQGHAKSRELQSVKSTANLDLVLGLLSKN